MIPSVTGFTVTKDTPQVDGRFWVTEVQDISDGTSQTYTYLAEVDSDYNAIATIRSATLNAEFQAAAIYVPSEITLIQAHRAIDAVGLRTTVESAVAQAPQSIQDLWYTTEMVQRNDPNLIALATSIGLTSDQVDDLFRQGAKL